MRGQLNVKFSLLYVHLRESTQFIQNFTMIYLLTAVGLTPGGSSTVHICTNTQTVHRTQLTTLVVRLSGI